MFAIDEIIFHLAKIEELKKTHGITEEDIYKAKYFIDEGKKNALQHEQRD